MLWGILALTVSCPKCDAPVQEACMNLTSGLPSKRTHTERISKIRRIRGDL